MVSESEGSEWLGPGVLCPWSSALPAFKIRGGVSPCGTAGKWLSQPTLSTPLLSPGKVAITSGNRKTQWPDTGVRPARLSTHPSCLHPVCKHWLVLDGACVGPQGSGRDTDLVAQGPWGQHAPGGGPQALSFSPVSFSVP